MTNATSASTNRDEFGHSGGESLKGRLVAVLERYLIDLEQGLAPDQQSVLAAHPDLADELGPYLENLRLVHGATHEIRQIKTAACPPDNDMPGARSIGEYRIIREIGRGGMGIVYEAHQQSLARRVALKILPFAAVLDQRQIARFRNEAQAAAQLHHPHIVPVFAVGQELGVYYYAMQYIDGQSLEQAIAQMRQDAQARQDRSTRAVGAANGSTTTRHLDAAAGGSSPLSNRCRDYFRTVAGLGKQAAEALEHAHQFGIVHRDVKPSNLLIDEHGKLWVTDFGLARVQSDGGVTLTGDVMGTLRYMSPEQAAGHNALVDARTDVYSLGVTLYELLTLKPAFTADDRQGLLRQVTSEDPVPPRRINSAIPQDLETIVLTATAKSRDERYPSARALADDLERFLAGKPTLARRPVLIDRAAKWARRHRPLVAAILCAMMLLSVVSAVGVALLAREQARTRAALDQAEINAQTAQENYQRAERHFLEARGAVDRFGPRLADRLLEIPGAEPLRRELLVDTLGYYRQFAAEVHGDPQLRDDAAVAHFRSGEIAAKLGATGDAIAEYQAAERLLAEVAAADANAAEPRARLAMTHNNLALLLAAGGDTPAARGRYAAAIGLLEQVVRQHAGDPQLVSRLAECRANYGMLLDQIGEAEHAQRSLRAAVDALRPLAESMPREPSYARDLAIASNNLSFVLRTLDAQAAEAASDEAIGRLRRLSEQFPTALQYQDDLALCCNNRAALASFQDRLDDAIRWHREAIALAERLVRKAPAVVRHRADLATSLNNLGVAYCRQRQSADADAAFARARDLLTTLVGDYPEELVYPCSLAALLNNQALALDGAGRHKDALPIYPRAIELQRACLRRSPDSASVREALSKTLYNHGQSLLAVGRLVDAADAALARRELWTDNGERLLAVAAELSEISRRMRNGLDASRDDAARRKLDDTVVATLWQVHERGWPAEFDLAADQRFTDLHGNQRFAALVAERKSAPAQSRAQASVGGPADETQEGR